MDNLKKYYSDFFKDKEGQINLAPHSHHFWPDITKEATLNYWNDSAKFVDGKWNHFFSEVIPKTREIISSMLGLTNPGQIAFAPNTHELLTRLLSCFFEQDQVNVLTTDSEFHSFDRQIKRLSEWDKFNVKTVNTDDDSFEDHLITEAKHDYDIIFISHVFYNSGKLLNSETIRKIIANKPKKTILIIDGYHSFCAIPFLLTEFENDVFFLAGGYKYAQAGEGMCFMTIPKNTKLRPLDTGWFAHFESLTNKTDEIEYSEGGDAFWGATQDMTPFYRFNAVWKQFKDNEINIKTIYDYTQKLQNHFAESVQFTNATLMNTNIHRARFLSYKFKTEAQAIELEQFLGSNNIFVDRRNMIIRFGFAPYHSKEDIEQTIIKLRSYC